MRRVALALVMAFVVAGCTTGGSRDAPPAPPTSTAAGAATSASAEGDCPRRYPPTPLPTWARTGFSDPEPSAPHVLSDKGDMAAILWAPRDPLVAPPAADRNNKILWVARIGAADGPLELGATLEGTAQTVSRTVDPAPGPSIIDLPAPGCWSLDLSWGHHRDHLVLRYAPG